MLAPILVCTPSQRCDAQLAIAAARFGEIGVLDLGYDAFNTRATESLALLANHLGAESPLWGLRWDMLGSAERGPAILRPVLGSVAAPLILLDGVSDDTETRRIVLDEARQLARRVYLEVHSCAEALAAQEAGYDGVIVKGNECGGWVGTESALLLLQHLHKRLRIPYWVRGAIGPDTAAAAIVAGAAGVVLGEQLWLTSESPFSPAERRFWRQCDGSETIYLGAGKMGFRLCARLARPAVAAVEKTLAEGGDWVADLSKRLCAPAVEGDNKPVPLGQEIAFAAKLSENHVTVADVLRLYRQRIEANPVTALQQRALAAGSSLAKSHGTEYPILQGPMTRVSDVDQFGKAVSDSGALPFLALALMSGPEVRRLLGETSKTLAGRPWGVGLLGFVPPQLRNEQLEVIAEFSPRYAIIAGGRPSQAQELEKRGTASYLHVPSPGLLDAFIREGARRFIFEGRECGGHVGPRSSFVLWQSAIDVLLSCTNVPAEEFHIVFAGGIHDALSAAMVATLAARLAERGMKIGVLMGTAYLFCPEAVQTGAITAEFQRQAFECKETVLLESGVGHATRAARTTFTEEFLRIKGDMLRAGAGSDEIRIRLELLNVGRLRIAAKGVTRNAANGDLGTKGDLKPIDEATQKRDGLYMIGQVATLRDKPVSMAHLHAEVCEGSDRLLENLNSSTIPQRLRSSRPGAGLPIAIVGMSCVFPGAENLRQYWQNICNRVDAIQEVPPERWRLEDYYSKDFQARDRVYSRWGGFLGKFIFDPIKWQIPPAALASIEPVQMLALEVANQAFIDAGFDRRPFPRERTSVLFAVAGSHDLGTSYCVRTMLRHYLNRLPEESRKAGAKIEEQLAEILPEWTEDSFPGFLANVVAGRIARELNLGGPNYIVDAACASSLAALHAGIEQLRSGTSDVVLIGGADLTNNAFCYMSFAKTYALSPRGRCRPFDDSADGIVLGEGLAAVLLKRLADARRDGDRIYAVIKGIGASGDGKVRTLTAPSPKGQTLALERAYEDAGVQPTTVSLIEAHGTGTVVGDRSELASLQSLYSNHEVRPASTAIGSVKSMIGHTKTVAGLAGLIKTVLALKHGVLPPTIGVEKPTTKFSFAEGPFYLNTETRPWICEEEGYPRRAGVSAFGFGGTNFHVVLEEDTSAFHAGNDVNWMPRSAELFLFRGNSRDEVMASVKSLHESLQGVPEGALAELAAALAAAESDSATPKKARLGIVAGSLQELCAKLSKSLSLLSNKTEINDPSGVYYSECAPATGRVCFLYPGQGSQRVGMLSKLVSSSPWAASWFAQANRATAEYLSEPLSRLIYPTPAFDEDAKQRQRQALKDTRAAQPALGLVEVFASELLRRFGIAPDMVAGHSYGELAALWAAGCLHGDSLLRLSALRGRFCAEAVKTIPGGMVAVAAGAAATEAALRELHLDAVIANYNAPDQTIVAGSETVLATLPEQLARRGLRAQKIDVSAPFHTAAMRPASAAFAAVLNKVPLRRPRLPVYSNTTAQRHADDPAVLAATLVRQLHEPVRFEEQVRRLHADGARLFLEIGPGKVLTDLVRRILKDDSVCAISLDQPDREDWTQLAHLLARSAALGLGVSLSAWFQGRGRQSGSVAEVLSRVRQQGQIKPTDWIIQAGRAEPVTPLPGKRRPAASTSPAPAISDPPVANRIAAAAGSDRRAMPPLAVAPVHASVVSVSISSESKQMPARLRQPVAEMPAATLSARTTNVSESASETSHPLTQGMPAPMITAAQQSATNDATCVPLTGPEMFAQFQATTSELFKLQMAQQQVIERYLQTQERMLQICLQGDPRAPAAVTDAPAADAANGVHPVAPRVRPAVTLPGRGIKAPPQVPAGSVVIPPQSKVPVPVPSPATAVAESRTIQPGTNGHAKIETQKGADAPPPTEIFRRDLLQIVSERTGYPIEMLDENLPLEASLGIDSIKTVEIFSKLKDYHSHFQEMTKGMSEEQILVSFTKLKTLKDVIDNYDTNLREYLKRTPGSAVTVEQAVVGPPTSPPETVPEALKLVSRVRQHAIHNGEVDDAVARYVLRPVPLAPAPRPETSPRGRYIIVLLGDSGELTEALTRAAMDVDPPLLYQIAPGPSARPVGANRYEADFSSPESLRQVRGLLMGSGDTRIGGVLNCLSLCPQFAVPDPDEQAPLQLSLWSLNVIKEFIDDLSASVVEGGGWFMNLTPLGGKYGLESPAEDGLPLAAAATLGMVKTLDREYPKLRVRNVDIDPTLSVDVLLPQLLCEGALDGPQVEDRSNRLTEVGLNGEGRWRLELQKEPLPSELAPLELGADSVVLVLGGAQGITASVSKALAATGCHLVIAGLSPIPQEEPAEFVGLERSDLRQLLLMAAKEAGQSVQPADIERKCNRILKDQQIRATLKACEAAGGKVEYHTLDVRDSEKLSALLDNLYERFGRIDGVVHGAGVIEDKLLPTKSAESFSRVFTTKVGCALTLARKLKPEQLRFLLFFSSVSARFGNPGQADYAAANEVLNKLSSELGRRWPARVVSVNWGPWDGGMVAEPARDVRHSYAQLGIGLIPLAEGAAASLGEARLGAGYPGEVLISASVARMIEMCNLG